MGIQSARNTSISKHRLGCRLPCESPSVGDNYAAPGPVVTYKLSPEELARYGPVNKTTDRSDIITAKSIEWAVKKAETLQEAAGLLKISQEQFLEKANEAGIEMPEDWRDEDMAKRVQINKEQVEQAINDTNNITEARKILGIANNTMYKLMEKYDLKAKNARKQKEDKDESPQNDYTKLANWLNMDKPQEPLVNNSLDETEPTIERGTYEVFGQNLGRLVDEKQRAYGQAFQKIGQISKILYPNGVPVEKLDDFALVVRVLDKICRIADGDKAAFGESPWRDIAGYGLLGYVESEELRDGNNTL